MSSTSPHWDLTNVYPGLDSQELRQSFEAIQNQTAALESALQNIPSPDAGLDILASACEDLISKLNDLYELSRTVRSYIDSFVTTDSYNLLAARLLSEYDQLGVGVQQQNTRFRAWVGRIAPRLEEVIGLSPLAARHAFFLRETARQSQYLMAPEMEDLAAELNLSGANAWAKLQGVLTSQYSMDFELDGQVQTLTLPKLINLHTHPDETVRRRAYEAELKAEASLGEPLAAAMNGIKNAVNTLDSRRGRTDALHSAIDTARIDRETLEAMLSAMQESFPVFQRYFQAKARRMGKERLAWWDLFAPGGADERSFSFDEAKAFILEHFNGFSPDLAKFAQRAFDQNWIDAEPRKGKRGGAFCMDVPMVKESRVLCNFDGTLDQVSTIAHELGHAFHADCIYQAGKTELQSLTPMTLAETASILCETIITEAALRQANSPQEEIAILEVALINDSQVIVDIFARYLFEKEVFERRKKAELSPQELCEIMIRAQKSTYGEGLDERYLHPYMWTWKPHYYDAELSFYNFPYAFGLLFGIGLYAIYQKRGSAFIPEYKALLAATGEGSAAELASRFGIDIRSKLFWEQSLAVIARRIERYARL